MGDMPIVHPSPIKEEKDNLVSIKKEITSSEGKENQEPRKNEKPALSYETLPVKTEDCVDEKPANTEIIADRRNIKGDDEEGNEYVVEKILNHRLDADGKKQYLLKWKGNSDFYYKRKS